MLFTMSTMLRANPPTPAARSVPSDPSRLIRTSLVQSDSSIFPTTLLAMRRSPSESVDLSSLLEEVDLGKSDADIKADKLREKLAQEGKLQEDRAA